MAFFEANFTKLTSQNGKVIYSFQSCYKETQENYNSKPPLGIDGDVYFANSTVSEVQALLSKRPEQTNNPVVLKEVFEQWLSDCSGAFVKPPTIEKCLANCKSEIDTNSWTASILNDEEESDWLIQWMPTSIQVEPPTYTVLWSPCYKIPYTRRVEEKIPIDDLTTDIELQNPEKTYTILPQATRLLNGEWLQELTDVSMPLSDSPTLRLDVDLDGQREKMRRRVRDARIRAKLARYRAERLASRYEARFGDYPSEDEDEAHTEVETECEE